MYFLLGSSLWYIMLVQYFWMNNYYYIVKMCSYDIALECIWNFIYFILQPFTIVFIHSPTDICLCFQICTIVNSADTNILVSLLLCLLYTLFLFVQYFNTHESSTTICQVHLPAILFFFSKKTPTHNAFSDRGKCLLLLRISGLLKNMQFMIVDFANI